MSSSDQPTEPTATASTDEPGEPTGPSDDVKEKFREALARKQGKEQGVPHHSESTGPARRSQDAKTQRMFRRKSG
jgi:hypothetical protein